MDDGWLILAGAIAVVDWVAVAKKWKWLEDIAKPGTMAVLLIWLILAGGLSGPLLPFTLGAFFSLIGDIMLMLPNALMAGLIAFLLAHASYIIGFNSSPPPLGFYSIVMAALVGIIAGRLYRHIAIALAQKGERKLRIPSLIYAATITLMLISALLTTVKPDWRAFPALLSSVGAILFFASDSLLAWDRFVEPVPNRGLKVMLTYHLGQFALLAGAVLNFHG